MWTYTCTACGETVAHPEQAKARELFTEHATVKHKAHVILMADGEDKNDRD